MDFKDLLDYCRAEAISNTLANSEVAVWRSLCRNYSKKFSTPLHLCLDGTIPAEDILLAEFEDQLDDFDEDKHLDAIMETINRLEDPNYDEILNKELEEFMTKVAEEERERIRLGKPIHKAMQKETDLENTSEKQVEETPKQSKGYVNLAYLQEEEINQVGGFEDP